MHRAFVWLLIVVMPVMVFVGMMSVYFRPVLYLALVLSVSTAIVCIHRIYAVGERNVRKSLWGLAKKMGWEHVTTEDLSPFGFSDGKLPLSRISGSYEGKKVDVCHHTMGRRGNHVIDVSVEVGEGADLEAARYAARLWALDDNHLHLRGDMLVYSLSTGFVHSEELLKETAMVANIVECLIKVAASAESS